MEKPKIEFTEFMEIANKLEIKVGMIVEAKRIPKKDKLLEMVVAFGPNVKKTCVTNLGEKFEPEDFLGNKLPFIMNLQPAKMGGVESEVMLMVSQIMDEVDIDINNFPIGSDLM